MTSAVVIAGWFCMGLAGVFLAMQSGMNLTLGSHIGKSLASVVSFGTGLVVLTIFFAIDTQAVKGSPMPTRQGAASSPWWSWFGGPLGAFYVASIIIFAPKLGAANSLSVFVATQLTMALILDSFGLLGYKKRPFHFARAIGLVLLIVGVILVAKFEGKSHEDSSKSAMPAQPSEMAIQIPPSSTSSTHSSPASSPEGSTPVGPNKARLMMEQLPAVAVTAAATDGQGHVDSDTQAKGESRSRSGLHRLMFWR